MALVPGIELGSNACNASTLTFVGVSGPDRAVLIAIFYEVSRFLLS